MNELRKRMGRMRKKEHFHTFSMCVSYFGNSFLLFIGLPVSGQYYGKAVIRLFNSPVEGTKKVLKKKPE